MQDWATAQIISHWIITCFTWGIITFFLLRYVRKKYNWNVFEKKEKMKLWNWIIIILIFIFLLIVSYFDWNGFKIIKEFNYNGLLKFIFQYLYYIFETLLIVLIVIFGQRAFEIWSKKNNFPFGGILCATTWGLVHMLTKGNLTIGLLSALYIYNIKNWIAFGPLIIFTILHFISTILNHVM